MSLKGLWVQRRLTWGKGGGATHTNHFERMQVLEWRERAQVTVFWRSPDFNVRSVLSSCTIGVQNQNKRPESKYNSSPLTWISIDVTFYELSSSKSSSGFVPVWSLSVFPVLTWRSPQAQNAPQRDDFPSLMRKNWALRDRPDHLHQCWTALTLLWRDEKTPCCRFNICWKDWKQKSGGYVFFMWYLLLNVGSL